VEAVKADDSERVMEELWMLLRKGTSEDEEVSPTESASTKNTCCS